MCGIREGIVVTVGDVGQYIFRRRDVTCRDVLVSRIKISEFLDRRLPATSVFVPRAAQFQEQEKHGVNPRSSRLVETFNLVRRDEDTGSICSFKIAVSTLSTRHVSGCLHTSNG